MVLRHELAATVVVFASMAAPMPAHAATQVPAPTAPASGAWTTYHHDNARTGYDPLAPAVGSVAPTSGWALTTLDAEVYAEPLIYNGLVYTATLNNTVYALNQSTGAVVWQNHLGAPVTGGWQCGNFSMQGILGTPVIDVAGGRIYATALFASDHLYRVFGLDLATGAVMLTTVLSPLGTGFDWSIQQQRGALAVANGYVYVPFGGRAGDCGPYHGWVVGVPTSGSTSFNVFETASTAEGIWAAGGVVVDDTSHNVFVATGNAIPCAGSTLSDSVIRLSPTLTSPAFFEPNDWQSNWCGPDSDLGSTSPVLISPNLMFMAGKHGGGFLLDPTNLGGVDGQLFPTPKPAAYAQANVCFGNTSNATFGSFAYLAPFVYVECESRGLVAINVNTSTTSFSPCNAACAAPDWSVGSGTVFGPPIVAGGAVWAASNSGLYAFNATTGAVIYHSASFGINRFVTPAEAGGQVLVPSHTVIRSFTIAAPPPPPPPAAYTAVAPQRIMDTRDGTGGVPVAKLGAGATMNLTVAGVTPVPAAATSVILNVTAVNTTAPSFLAVYPTGQSHSASNLNWLPGEVVPNLVVVPIGSAGRVSFYNSAGSTDVVADLQGYFAAPIGTAGAEVGLPTPARITDTRPGSTYPHAGGTLAAGGSIDVQVTGAGGVPAVANVSAAILNVTVTNTTADGFLTVYAAGGTKPFVSNLNWPAGKTVPNRVIVPVGATGMVTLYNQFGSTDVIVDVSGYFTTAAATGKFFNAQSPQRVADTRSGLGCPASLSAGASCSLPIAGVAAFGVPSSATAVILNVTVTATSADGFLKVYPSGASVPPSSDLNWTAGQTVANLVVATLSVAGAATFYNQFGTTDVVVDLFGFFN